MKVLTFWLIIFFLAIITIFGLVTENITAKKAEITKLQQGMAELQTSVNELQGALDQKDEYIFELKGRVTELEGYINAADLLKASPRDTLKVIMVARENNVKPSLALGIVSTESDGDKNLVSYNANSYDAGLFQTNSITYKQYSKAELLNVDFNINLGIKHISEYINNQGLSIEYSLLCYNRGTKGADNFVGKYGTSISNYVDRVLEKQKQFDFIT